MSVSTGSAENVNQQESDTGKVVGWPSLSAEAFPGAVRGGRAKNPPADPNTLKKAGFYGNNNLLFIVLAEGVVSIPDTTPKEK